MIIVVCTKHHYDKREIEEYWHQCGKWVKLRPTPKRASTVTKESILRSEPEQFGHGQSIEPDLIIISKIMMVESKVLRFSQMLLKFIIINNHIKRVTFCEAHIFNRYLLKKGESSTSGQHSWIVWK